MELIEGLVNFDSKKYKIKSINEDNKSIYCVVRDIKNKTKHTMILTDNGYGIFVDKEIVDFLSNYVWRYNKSRKKCFTSVNVSMKYVIVTITTDTLRKIKQITTVNDIYDYTVGNLLIKYDNEQKCDIDIFYNEIDAFSFANMTKKDFIKKIKLPDNLVIIKRVSKIRLDRSFVKARNIIYECKNNKEDRTIYIIYTKNNNCLQFNYSDLGEIIKHRWGFDEKKNVPYIVKGNNRVYMKNNLILIKKVNL